MRWVHFTLQSLEYNEWKKVGFVYSQGNSNSSKVYSFTDELNIRGNYLYRLILIDNDGSFKYSNFVEVSFVNSLYFELAQNFPNPFNPYTVISFNLPQEGRVIIKVFDMLGREVITLLNENMTAGQKKVVWEGKDNFGKDVTSGIYFYNLNFNEQSITKKMLMVR